MKTKEGNGLRNQMFCPQIAIAPDKYLKEPSLFYYNSLGCHFVVYLDVYKIHSANQVL
jgi:hypothetical protein